METIKDAENVIFSKASGVELIVLATCYEDGTSIHRLFTPKWKEINTNQFLSLDDIRKQAEKLLNKTVITVIAEYPLRGIIYRFGNYDRADWVRIGNLDGYA